MARTSPGAVAGLELVRRNDPRPVQRAKIDEPLVGSTVAFELRVHVSQAAPTPLVSGGHTVLRPP